ncbi:sigma-70 family RNA polymerase sigma factor [Lysobacter hankyongensis]
MDAPRARFAALLDTHRGIVFKVANTYCRHAEDRQDLAQEIAAQLWRAFHGYDPARPFSTWMYRIALNVAISHVRTAGGRARDVPLDDRHDEHQDGLSVDDGTARHESDQRIRALHAVIDRQPPLDRALLLLWLEERTQREIADVLGITESNVSTKLNRLKQRIREQLADIDPS